MKIIRYFIENSLLKFIDFWGQGFWGYGNGSIDDLQTFLKNRTEHYKAQIVTIEDTSMAKVEFVLTLSYVNGAIIDTSFLDTMPLNTFIDRFYEIDFDSINIARLQVSTLECKLSEIYDGYLPPKYELQNIISTAEVTNYVFDPNTNICNIPIKLNERLNHLAEVVNNNGIISLVKPNSATIWQELKRRFLTTSQA